MGQSAFILRVSEAEALVAELRQRLDPAACLGVPAHITLLFPFSPPERITERMLEQARMVVASARIFPFRLARIERFPGTLYLAPEPAAPFVALTEALARRFPEYPPYADEFDTIIPHLTVAHGDEAELRAAEIELRRKWPSTGVEVGSCTHASLIENSSGRWKSMHELALADAAR